MPPTDGSPQPSSRQGVVFPADPDGRVSTLAVNQAVFVEAVAAVDPDLGAVLEAEKDWRAKYARHIRRLLEVGMRSEENAMRISADGLRALRERMVFRRGDDEIPIDEAMQRYHEPTLGTATVVGRGERPMPELSVPYRGGLLQGDDLREQADDWAGRGIVEPSFVEALTLVIDNPDWLDLSDQKVVVLGAGSEMGPLEQMCQWGAHVWALDLPRPEIWRRVVRAGRLGRGLLHVPVPLDHPLAGKLVEENQDGEVADVAGSNVIVDAPEVLTWLSGIQGPLVVGNYVYADGGTHVQASVAIDAIMTGLQGRDDPLMLAFLATPTDVFSVPAEVVSDAHQRLQDSVVPTIVAGPLNTLSGHRAFEPHYRHATYSDEDRTYGIADNLVVRQGPNYALAKRMQRWRASVARAEGTRVSLNIAPPTRTRSVVKNRAFALAYAGMGRFGLEVFDPPASNALMAALMVHDLRNPQSSANPEVPLKHPLDFFVDGANPGGMWRSAYEPNSITAAAAVAGLFEGRA